MGSVITADNEVVEVARLLGMEKEEVEKILITRLLPSQKEQVFAKLDPTKAKYSRDALAKVSRCGRSGWGMGEVGGAWEKWARHGIEVEGG